MSKKIWLVLVIIMASFFMPNVYAEETNYYELKVYEKGSVNDFSEKDFASLNFMLDKELLLDSYDDSKEEVYDSNNKLLFTTYYADYSVVVNEKLTTDDNIEYTFTTDDKSVMEEYFSELASYDGIKLLLTENEPCNSGVCIEKVELDSKSETAKILSNAKRKNLSVKFGIRFSKANDFVKYKIIVDNMTDEDYKISEENNFDGSKYVSYEYSYEDGSNIAKKNSKKIMYVTIKYSKQVPEEEFNDGVFTEKNNLAINLDNSKNSGILENPNTGYNLLVIGIILFMAVGLTIVVYKKTGNKKYLSIIILSLALLPVSIYAMGKFQISVESNIIITKGEVRELSFVIGSCGQDNYYEQSQRAITYEYEAGMTWGEWSESKYNVDRMKLFLKQKNTDIRHDYTHKDIRHFHISPELLECHKLAKTDEELYYCEKQIAPLTFDYDSMILNDGLYYLSCVVW